MSAAAGLVVALMLMSIAARPVSAQTGVYDTVRVNGLVAHLHRPAVMTSARMPAVVLLGGSGGGIGWQDYIATMLADRGIVALAVAYFGMEGLPKELDRIPVEYVDHAIEFIRSQPYVDRKRVGIGGVSKGGELALLMASTHPELRAVGVFVPSGIVFQSIAAGFPNTSSWSRKGRDVPFVQYGTVPDGASLADRYVAGIKQATPAVLDAATIRVEKIRGPVLMLSGKADNLFASATLAGMVEARLKSKHFKYGVEHIAYENAGHLISSIRDDASVVARGGTVEGNAFAQRDGQRRFLEFFVKSLAR